MGLPKAQDYENFAEYCHPENKELALLFAMSNISDSINKLYIEFLNVCYKLENNDLRSHYEDVGKAMLKVHDATMYKDIAKYYIERYRESSEKDSPIDNLQKVSHI